MSSKEFEGDEGFLERSGYVCFGEIILVISVGSGWGVGGRIGVYIL